MNINFSNYGQERERIATESEIEIFEILRTMTGADDLQLVRKSDNYVSAVISDWDLARFKYTPRAKWISFPLVPPGSEKHRFEQVEDIRNMSELVAQAFENLQTQLKYSKY